MPGDHVGRAADHHLIDVAADQYLAMAVGHGHGVVVVPVAHQRQRAHPPGTLVTGVVRSRRQRQQGVAIPLEALADRLLVAPQPRALAPPALRHETIVQGIDALDPRHRHQEVAPDEAYQPLDLALAGPAEPVLEQVVRLELREDTRSLPRAVAQDPCNRQLRVVVQDRARDAAEECKRRVVTIAERLGRFRRVGLHEAAVAVRQIQCKEVHLARHTADHRHRLAEVHLGVARGMMQPHEHLPRPQPALTHIVLHDADCVKTLDGGGFRPTHGDVRVRHETHSWH